MGKFRDEAQHKSDEDNGVDIDIIYEILDDIEIELQSIWSDLDTIKGLCEIDSIKDELKTLLDRLY